MTHKHNHFRLSRLPIACGLALLLALLPLAPSSRHSSAAPVGPAASVVCVDAHAAPATSPSGGCWTDPYPDLEQALERARADRSIKEIWVAEGVYKPSRTYTPTDASGNSVVAGAMSLPQYNPGVTVDGELRSYDANAEAFNRFLKTFDLVNKVDIYGGFQGASGPRGGERSIAERGLPTEHVTILDGDLDGDPSTEDNVWHVITAGNDITSAGVTVKLDRLTVRNGNALNAPYFPTNFPLEAGQVPNYYHDDGGGLYVFTRSTVHLSDMTFERNSGVAGGAVFAQDGTDLTITHSAFRDNNAYDGGGITVSGGGPNDLSDLEGRLTTLTIEDTVFERNSEDALNPGPFPCGCILVQTGFAVFTRDNLREPPANLAGAKLTVSRSTFADHRQDGFGAVTLSAGTGVISESTFARNSARTGGAIACFQSKISIEKNLFENNTGTAGAGATLANGCDGMFVNNVYRNNQTNGVGGAVVLTRGGEYEFVGNTFESNQAATRGGAIMVQRNAVVSFLVNNVFDGNQAGTAGGAIFTSLSTGAQLERVVNNRFTNNTPDDLGSQ